MTNGELTRKILADILSSGTDEELAKFICYNDVLNMALMDKDVPGITKEEKVLAFLKQEANVEK